MDREFWVERWESNQIGFNQAQPNKLLQRYFPNLKLHKGANVLVPLCGKSIDMLWLAESGYRVTGIELSTKACESFFLENGLSYEQQESDDFVIWRSKRITIICGDFFNLQSSHLKSIDAVYDRASLIALPKNVRKKYSNHLGHLLKPKTQVLLITSSYEQNQMEGPPFSVDCDEVKKLFENQFITSSIYIKSALQIPEHLKDKGLSHLTEHVYVLEKK
tara:strand:- start:67 stop:723 length:657 start_codon:yes stop_codon:yes gene_type:complete